MTLLCVHSTGDIVKDFLSFSLEPVIWSYKLTSTRVAMWRAWRATNQSWAGLNFFQRSNDVVKCQSVVFHYFHSPSLSPQFLFRCITKMEEKLDLASVPSAISPTPFFFTATFNAAWQRVTTMAGVPGVWCRPIFLNAQWLAVIVCYLTSWCSASFLCIASTSAWATFQRPLCDNVAGDAWPFCSFVTRSVNGVISDK